jgi:hypothetical protein
MISPAFLVVATAVAAPTNNLITDTGDRLVTSSGDALSKPA